MSAYDIGFTIGYFIGSNLFSIILLILFIWLNKKVNRIKK